MFPHLAFTILQAVKNLTLTSTPESPAPTSAPPPKTGPTTWETPNSTPPAAENNSTPIIPWATPKLRLTDDTTPPNNGPAQRDYSRLENIGNYSDITPQPQNQEGRINQ